MSTGLGIKGIIGAGKQTNEQTAVNATDKVLFNSEDLHTEPSFVDHEYLYGGAGKRDSQIVFRPVVGPIETPFPYTEKGASGDFIGSDLLLAAAMGTVVWNVGETNNELTFQDELNVFLTLAVDKGVNAADGSTWECECAFINQFVISASNGENLSLAFETQSINQVITGSENTPAELQALDDDIPSLANFSDVTFKIGDQSNTIQGVTADNVSIQQFSITVNNNLTEPQQASPGDLGYAGGQVHSDPLKSIKPVRNGFREVMIELTLPRYDDDSFLDWRDNETKLQAEFTITDGTNTIWIYVPNCKVLTASDPVAGQEAIQETVSIKAFMYNDHGFMEFQDGVTTDAGELWIELSNERTAAIF
jgi:hypothetical protein